jgi:hypothetical protein
MGDEKSYPKPDWAHWRLRDLWGLDQAVALSLGIEPSRVVGDCVRMPGMDASQLPGRAVSAPGKLLVLKPLPAEYFERLEIARSCAGMSLPVREGRPSGELVEPAQFVAWARVKEFALPCELDHPASHPATPSKPTPGSPGRRRKSGSINDEQDLRRMLEMLADGLVPSVLAAARAVASQRPPAHSIRSYIERLRKKFAAQWGTEPPAGKTWGDVRDDL